MLQRLRILLHACTRDLEIVYAVFLKGCGRRASFLRTKGQNLLAVSSKETHEPSVALPAVRLTFLDNLRIEDLSPLEDGGISRRGHRRLRLPDDYDSTEGR